MIEPTTTLGADIETIKVREAGVVYTKSWVVEIILDLAEYTPDRRLAELVAFEPSAGDGAFLRAMVRRLVESCRLHDLPLSEAEGAIQAFEIDPKAALEAIAVVCETLTELGVEDSTASELADNWIKVGDFLEASLGFPIADFVIGNPPYIRLEEIPPAKAQFYRSSFDAMTGRADLYVAFYQAALLQLKPGGVCAYICADRWLLNEYGGGLREFITTKGFNVRYIVETHDVDAFESEVSAYPAITIISNGAQGTVVVAKALGGIETAPRDRVTGLIRSGHSDSTIRAASFDDWFHGSEPWPCHSPDRLRLLKKLEATCLPLESALTGTRIGIGVATGADRVYVSKETAGVEKERLLPLAMASDLESGVVNWSGNYLLNPWDEDGLVALDEFPGFAARLRPHKTLLDSRNTAQKAAPERWHKTIDRVNLSLIKREKLYIADIKDRLLPALDEGKTYPHHNLYWITSDTWDMKVLGGILMSAVGEFFIHCYAVRMRGGYLRFQAQYLRRIRVPPPEKLTKELRATLRDAFDSQNVELATKAAMAAYNIDSIPN
jgi:adenine-specific DNA-methyltransferase